jgi:hypothetical protein
VDRQGGALPRVPRGDLPAAFAQARALLLVRRSLQDGGRE